MEAYLGRYLVLLVGLIFPGTAAAACLLGDYSVRAEYDRSILVLTGRVTAEKPVAESGPHYDGVFYTVAVDEAHRGHPGRSLELFSENSSGRFPMQRSERYLLFISRDVDRLVVDNCGNSGPASEKGEALRAVRTFAGHRGGAQKPNKPLERAGVNPCADLVRVNAGRSAPFRYTD